MAGVHRAAERPCAAEVRYANSRTRSTFGVTTRGASTCASDVIRHSWIRLPAVQKDARIGSGYAHIRMPSILTVPKWAREHFERGYGQRWGLPPVSDRIRLEAGDLWDQL